MAAIFRRLNTSTTFPQNANWHKLSSVPKGPVSSDSSTRKPKKEAKKVPKKVRSAFSGSERVVVNRHHAPIALQAQIYNNVFILNWPPFSSIPLISVSNYSKEYLHIQWFQFAKSFEMWVAYIVKLCFKQWGTNAFRHTRINALTDDAKITFKMRNEYYKTPTYIPANFFEYKAPLRI